MVGFVGLFCWIGWVGLGWSDAQVKGQNLKPITNKWMDWFAWLVGQLVGLGWSDEWVNGQNPKPFNNTWVGWLDWLIGLVGRSVGQMGGCLES